MDIETDTQTPTEILFNKNLCLIFLKEAFSEYIWVAGLISATKIFGGQAPLIENIIIIFIANVILAALYATVLVTIFKLKIKFSKRARITLSKLSKEDQAKYMGKILESDWDN